MEDFNVSEMEHRLPELVIINDTYPPELVNRAKQICDNLVFLEFRIEYLRGILNNKKI